MKLRYFASSLSRVRPTSSLAQRSEHPQPAFSLICRMRRDSPGHTKCVLCFEIYFRQQPQLGSVRARQRFERRNRSPTTLAGKSCRGESRRFIVRDGKAQLLFSKLLRREQGPTGPLGNDSNSGRGIRGPSYLLVYAPRSALREIEHLS
jgi:hypothetical protein